MIIRIIFTLVVLLLVVTTAVQNAAPVVLKFLTFQFEMSLALLLFLVLTSGIMIGMVLFLPVFFKKSSTEPPDQSTKTWQ